MNAIDFFEQYQPVAVAHEVLGVSTQERVPARIVDTAERLLRDVVDQTAQPDLRDLLCRLIHRSCRHMRADLATIGAAVDCPPSRLKLVRGEPAPSFN